MNFKIINCTVNMLCAPVSIFTSGSSALECRYLPYSIYFSEFMPFFFSRENGQNTKTLEARHFRMIRRWPLTVIRRNTERASFSNRKALSTSTRYSELFSQGEHSFKTGFQMTDASLAAHVVLLASGLSIQTGAT